MHTEGERGAYIEYLEVGRVPGAVRNPKEHDIGLIIESIGGRFGYVDPGMVDERTGRLLKGHGRQDALMVMKVKGEAAPRNVRVGERGEWYWPVVRGIASESDEEAEAYIVADNRIGEVGGWEERVLADMLKDAEALIGEEGLLGTGFDGDDLDRMLAALAREEREEGGLGMEEEGIGVAEEAQEIWRVEEGDIWRVEGKEGLSHYLICGDCRDEGAWGGLLSTAGVEREGVNGIVTSPPYAEQRKGKYESVREGDYVLWFREVAAAVMRHLGEDGSFFLNIKPHVVDGARSLYVNDLVGEMVREWGWKLVDEFVWLRTTSPGSWPNRFKNGFESVYHFGRTTAVKFRPGHVKGEEEGRFERHAENRNTGGYFNTDNTEFEWDGALPSNVVEVRRNVERLGHAAAFPVELPLFFIRAFSDKGDVWCDPFLGSGSSLVACEMSGRVGLGIERKKEYVALSLERLSKVCECQPVRVGQGIGEEEVVEDGLSAQ